MNTERKSATNFSFVTENYRCLTADSFTRRKPTRNKEARKSKVKE